MKNYFKKILIMFVMVLTLIGVGVIQNGTIANAATVGQELKEPEENWQRYNCDDKSITYEGGEWSYGTAWRESYHSSYGIRDSKIKFNFTGTKLRVIDGYWTTNSKDCDLIIDGKIIDKYVTYNGECTGENILVYEKLGLSEGEHSVEIINNTTEYLSINSIDVDGKILSYNKEIKNESISLDKSSMNIRKDQAKQLIATTTPAGAKVVWSSSNENIAKVDENGNVTGVKEGQVTITAQIKGSETKAICAVTVSNTIDPNDGNTNPTDNNDGTSNIVNIAHAKGENTNNAGGQVSIIFKGVAEAQLKVIKTADVDSVYVGDTFTYTIEVTNISDKVAKSVVINDNAPNHIDFIVNGITTTQGKVDSSSTSKNIVVNVGDIQPSGKVTIKIPANVVV
ncbi:hypothetical protein UT300005_20070 [Clostridium sp. CTA-5]